MFNYDLILVGGSLSNSLLAWQLVKVKPWIRVLLLEKTSVLGGNQTWVFQGSEVSEEARAWLAPLISAQWPEYEVRFPRYRKTLGAPLTAVRSVKLNTLVRIELGDAVRLNETVESISNHQVTLASGEKLTAGLVIDGRKNRGFNPSEVGYQKMLGLEVRTSLPHSLKAPVLMDASYDQEEGFRYIQCLPWTADRLLIRELRLRSEKQMEPDSFRNTLFDYAKRQAWSISEIFREEERVRILPLSPNYLEGGVSPISLWEEGVIPGVERLGLCQPTLGRDLPHAVRWVEKSLSIHEKPVEWGPHLKEWTSEELIQQSTLSGLNRLLFRAPKPQLRYRLLQAFFLQQPAELLENFYSSRLEIADRVRLLLKTRPIPLAEWGALFQKPVLLAK